ncbi:hypothetical protein GBF38_001935 [Nibea albiflora]|uniref:Uncharacterized protein n=1 Tax=Nibea albiflora TaxID=240163 RepID=A0ACB7ECV4_NIBAL|nr:hypothetical protein GBF38_001935 [Nibea albiflora]
MPEEFQLPLDRIEEVEESENWIPQTNLQIDDKEFDIPQVDTPPTLESILNEVKYMLLAVLYLITHSQQ